MDPILTKVSAYGGKYQKELITQIFKSIEDQGITVLEDIKGATKFMRLKVGKGLRPYDGVFQGGDKYEWSDREVTPRMFQYDIHIDPKKFHNTFATETQDKHSKFFGLPYEKYIWAKTVQQIANELVESTIGDGIRNGGFNDKARNICHGFKKRALELIADGKAPIITGVLTDSNAVTKFEKFYTDAMSANKAYRKLAMVIYCSDEAKDKYVEHYRTKFGNDPANWSDDEKPMYLKKGKKKKVVIEAVDWLTDPNQLILAPKDNMVLATDKLSDINVINLVQDVYGLKGGITGTIDIQIIDDWAFWCNEFNDLTFTD